MNKITKVMGISLGINFLLAILKIVSGILATSKALIADGIHSFSDLSTDLMAMVGNKLASKEPDLKHPYGHGKLEYLTSIVIGVVILVLGFTLIYNSFGETKSNMAFIVMLISIFTIMTKFLLSKYLIKKAKEYDNSILMASGKESSADTISSIVVLISAIFMSLETYFYIFKYADTIASIIVGLFIIKTGFEVLKDNISTIIDEQVTDLEYLNSVRNIILKSKLVKKIDSLVILKLGYYYKLSCDLAMDNGISIKEAHDELERLEKNIDKYDKRIKYKTIHINPYLDE